MGPAEWDSRYAGRELLWTAEPNRFLAAEVADMTPGRALDLACGEGRNAVWLAQRGWEVTGVDFSSVALDKARRLAEARGVSGRLRLLEADLAEHVPEAGSADLVAVLYLQVPAPLRGRILARAAAALAPGGTLLFVAHDLANLEGGYGGPRDPDVLTTPEGVAADLAGLVVERAERVSRPVSAEAGEEVAIDTLVRASRPGRAGARGPRRHSGEPT